MDDVEMTRLIRNALLCSLLAALAACSAPASTSTRPQSAPDAMRALSSGAVNGFLNGEGGHTWLGIPFAAPPVGALRWRAPQPVAAWREPRPALAAGSPCPQYGWPNGGVGAAGTRQGQEDCLYLNVYAPRMSPREAASAHLPVMVWIHPGSNTIGHAAFFDGSRLATTQHMIVVMTNYRLGPFGWFILPAGGRPAPNGASVDAIEASGNWGNLDVLASLHWVQANAAAFGGDPGNVTVFGESAGATNALALLVSPLSAGLVHKVIVQSLGFGFAPPERMSHYRDDPEPGDEYSSAEILLKLVVQQGRAKDRESARALVATWNREEVAGFLRGIDPWVLYGAYHPSNIETTKFPTVYQDGAVVRKGDVTALLANPATHLAIPTIFGNNLEEAKLFMAFDPRLVVTLRGLPVWIRDPSAYDREAVYRALVWKADGVDSLARALATGSAPTYAYRWDWRDEGRRFGIMNVTRLVGAAHGLEVPFVFGSFDVGPQSKLLFNDANAAGRFALSDAMMSYWSEFAATGSPGRGRDGTLPEWPAWPTAEPAPRLLVLNAPAAGGIRISDEEATRDRVVALMESQEPNDGSACTMFRATFRWPHDAWADAAWNRFRGGYCVGPAGAKRYLPPAE